MSKKTQPALIGAFVLGAITLAIAALFFVAGGDLWKKKSRYIMYFDGSVYGLQVGAPVVFRGVNIGLVRQIGIALDSNQQSSRSKSSSSPNPLSISTGSRWTSTTRWLRASSSPRGCVASYRCRACSQGNCTSTSTSIQKPRPACADMATPASCGKFQPSRPPFSYSNSNSATLISKHFSATSRPWPACCARLPRATSCRPPCTPSTRPCTTWNA